MEEPAPPVTSNFFRIENQDDVGLGGDAAFCVFDDADVDAAAEGAMLAKKGS